MPRIPKNTQYKKKRINKESNTNVVNSEIYLELIQYWNSVYITEEIYFNKEIQIVTSLLMSHVNSIMENQAYLNSRLSRYDEKVFEYYMDIISCYSTVEDIYNKHKNNIKSKNIQIILNGLMDVINSRINEFKELNNTNNNPIKLEKQQIVNKFINKFNKEIEGLSKPILTELNMLKVNFNYEDTINYIFKNYLNVIYNSYSKYLNESIKLLDQIEFRVSLDTYIKLIKHEEEVFTSIIKIQAVQLEQEQKDIELVQKILYQIRETYQRLCKNMDTLTCIQKQVSVNGNTQILSLNEFQNKVYNMLIKDKLTVISSTELYKKEYEKDMDIFLNCFNISLYNAIHVSKINKTKFNFKLTLNNSQKTYKDFAQNMINIFLDIINYSYSNGEALKVFEMEYKIIEGITDTLNIKIESIKESINNYIEDIECLNDDYTVPKNLLLDIVQIWLDTFNNCNTNIKKTDEFFNMVIRDKYDMLNTWFEKIKNNKLLSLEKKEFTYKKDYLLFEITTFEELINYSISRLKNSKQPPINLYVQVVEEANNKLHSLLFNNNIETIKPHPHEMFNGKEHEVILAEKEEGFKKGEIIKVSNSGYKQNDKVILRANVIAAK